MTETATAPSGPSGPLAKILTPSRASGLRTSGTTLASSLLAVIIALGISAVMLFITGKDPVTAFTTITDTAQNTDKLLEMMRRATPLIFSATAVAIGFKMNIFNIGVEGQYLFAALMAAEAGSRISLPGPLHIAAILAVALISGAAWAGISAFLKVRKNIHEVISTIMLNYIALSFIQWLFNSFFRDDSVEGLNIKTTIIEESGRLPDLVEGRLNSMFIIALVVVTIFWVVVYRSTFGFKLRASGYNPTAASTAGISATKMTVIALLLSGAVAGLVAMQSVLGETHAYGPSATPIQLGFAGITVALLGRNHPVGIVIAALLFGFLDSTSAQLQLADVPNSIVKVMQAIIVLTVVIVNEAAVRRTNIKTAERARAELAAGSGA